MKFSTYSKFFFSVLFVAALNFQASSQCDICTPDTECGGGTMPAFCPEQIADAYAGEYYEQVLTFYIPNTFTDPNTQLEATIISVTINSVSGLPFGITYTLNDADGVYHPSEGQNRGCVTICGTPILPGSYNVNISITAVVNALGFPLPQSQNFPTTMNVWPGQGSTSSFVYDLPADCGSGEVNFEASIVAPAPAVTTYAWDFGNGQTSGLQNPPTVIYDTEGEYTVSLTTTISEYKLQTVHLQGVTSSGWDGDEDIFGSPDPYFILSNGSGTAVYTSGSASNTSNNVWTDLDLSLENPPYTIQFFDEDLITDDNLGTADVAIATGEVSFNAGNGTLGTLTFSLDTTTQITDESVITVLPFADADFTVNGNVLTCNDPNLDSYIWYRNGVVINNATSSSYTMTQGGQYYCVVQNEYGCTSSSSTYLYCPPVTITYDAAAMELEVPNVYSSYQWYFNGQPIQGATTYYVLAGQSGDYSVQLTTSYGCNITSQVYALVVGIDEEELPAFSVYPNPVEDMLVIQCPGMRGVSPLRILDISGKVVLDKQITFLSDVIQLDMANIPAGVYIIHFNGRYTRIIRK